MQQIKTTTLLHQSEKIDYFCIIDTSKTITFFVYSLKNNKQKKRCFLGILILLISLKSFGQLDVKRAKISVFLKKDYSGGTQNWDIERDNWGRLFIANNEGLLIYDGINWQLHAVPNKTIVRSIALSSSGRIYAGAQDEFGYYEADKLGRLKFTSLKNLIPSSVVSFADVWDIQIIDQAVFFMTSQYIFCYKNNKISYFKPKSTWTMLKKHHSALLTQDLQNGILMYKNNQWVTIIEQKSLPKDFQITDIKPFGKDTSIISTTNNGLYLFTNNSIIPFTLEPIINERHFTTLDIIDHNSFLAGSYNSGLYKIDKQGNILGNISTKQGIASNTIRCIYSGFDGSSWIGMDNSIALIDWNNSIYHINPTSFNNGSGQGATSLNGNLYFALSTGLQYINLSKFNDLGIESVEPQIILNGLTWNVSEWNKQILACRDDGLWEINKNEATLLSKASGYWSFKPIYKDSTTQLAIGNYFGIRYFSSEQGKIKENGSIKNFVESSRYIETDNHYVWVSHPYHGLFKINTNNDSYKKFTIQDGLPSELENHVFKLKGKIVFATTKGIYEMAPNGGRIIPSKYYQNIFGEKPIRYLKEDPNGNIWFVQDKMLGVAELKDSKYNIKYIPELFNQILSGFENIYCLNQENTIIGSDIGFYNINYPKYTSQSFPYKTYISSVKTIGIKDSVIYGGYANSQTNKKLDFTIPYQSNSLRISFATTYLRHQASIEFSYYLKGYDKNWSKWSSVNEKDYTNLREGNYTFYLKSRYGPSNEFKEFSYSFHIMAPWYRSLWAYFLYVLLIALVIYIILKLQKRKLQIKAQNRLQAAKLKHEEEQRQMSYKHQLEIEKNEKAIIQLTNQNLQTEVKHKSEDLASTAMNLLQKKAFLGKLTSELNQLIQANKEYIDNTEIRKILRQLKSDEKLDEEWEKFSNQVKNVQSDFLNNLKKSYPELNANELKLCAYLRMNLSSKEIAQLFSISVRGVEISRYRLRKKLKLQTHQDLFEFLINFHNNEHNDL